MKAISPHSPPVFVQPPFWLVAVLVSLIGVNLTLVAQYATNGFLTLSLLFWLAVGYSLWEKSKTLDLQSGLGETLIGGAILGMSLATALTVIRHPSYLVPLQLLPFFGGIGCAILSSGFRGFKQYRRELALLFFLGFPPLFLRALPLNMTLVSAKFSTFLLWYLGWEVTRTDDVIRFSTGNIFVFPDCSGIEAMAYLCSLAVLISIFLGLPFFSKISLALVGILLGFLLNGIRVVLLTFFVASSQPVLFKFWHQGTGSLVFSFIGALLLCGVGYWLLRLNTPSEHPLAGFTRQL